MKYGFIKTKKKKILNMLFITMVVGILSGCGASIPDNPDEVIFKGKQIKVNDEAYDSLEADTYSLKGSIAKQKDLKEAGENGIFVNKDNKIRVISITNKSITTYKGIKVGDSIDKLEDTFDKGNYNSGNYTILFDEDNNELEYVDLDFSSIERKKIKAISYKIEDDKITVIFVTDYQYLSELV